jgi:hypothetical protein
MNSPEPLPLAFGFSLPIELSIAIKILGVAFIYGSFLFTLVLAGGMSHLTSQSKGYYIFPILTIALTLLSFLIRDSGPKISVFFSLIAFIFLCFAKRDKGYLSVAVVGIVGFTASLLSVVAGILWFEGHTVFKSAIASLLGLEVLSDESLKIGWAMLITTGYVIYYATFKTGDLWNDLT